MGPGPGSDKSDEGCRIALRLMRVMLLLLLSLIRLDCNDGGAITTSALKEVRGRRCAMTSS